VADRGALLRVVSDAGSGKVAEFVNSSIDSVRRDVSFFGVDVGADPKRLATLDFACAGPRHGVDGAQGGGADAGRVGDGRAGAVRVGGSPRRRAG